MSGTAAIDPVATGKISAPTRPAPEGIVYTFIGWNNLPAEITGPATVTAKYKSEAATYTVRFYDGNKYLRSKTVAYGEAAIFDGLIPADGNGTTFAGWYPNPVCVKSDMTCKALRASTTVKVEKIYDTWDTVLAAINDGSYVTRYKLGNYITLNCGSHGTHDMMIVGFGRDDRADGKGKAAMSFVSRNITPDKMFFGLTTDDNWVTSSVRTFLNNTLTIPQTVQDEIVAVRKVTWANPNWIKNENGEMNVITNDRVWILDYWGEMDTDSGLYKEVANAGDLDECRSSSGASSAISYWLRSDPGTAVNGTIPVHAYHYMMDSTSGGVNYTIMIERNPNEIRRGVRFGFCLA
jgi:hypothetical protein